MQQPEPTDSEMENQEEEEKSSSPSASEQILAKYRQMIERDMKFMEDKENNDQNPHSTAYISTCSFAQQKKLTKEEEKANTKEFYADKEKKLAALIPSAELKE